MNLSLPFATVLPAAFLLLAQAPAPTEVSVVSSFGAVGAAGVLGWLVWYQNTKVIPDRDRIYREEMAAERAANAAQTDKICAEFRSTSDRITAAFRDVIDEVRTRHRRFDEGDEK